MPVKIYVGNIPQTARNSELKELFEKFGKVYECDILKEFGFVHMEDSSDAKAAIAGLNDTLWKGNRIRVEISTTVTNKGEPSLRKKMMQHNRFNSSYDERPTERFDSRGFNNINRPRSFVQMNNNGGSRSMMNHKPPRRISGNLKTVTERLKDSPEPSSRRDRSPGRHSSSRSHRNKSPNSRDRESSSTSRRFDSEKRHSSRENGSRSYNSQPRQNDYRNGSSSSSSRHYPPPSSSMGPSSHHHPQQVPNYQSSSQSQYYMPPPPQSHHLPPPPPPHSYNYRGGPPQQPHPSQMPPHYGSQSRHDYRGQGPPPISNNYPHPGPPPMPPQMNQVPPGHYQSSSRGRYY